MKFDKVLLSLGILFVSVLTIENMVTPGVGYILWFTGDNWELVLVSAFIGVMLGYSIRGLLGGKKVAEEDNEF